MLSSCFICNLSYIRWYPSPVYIFISEGIHVQFMLYILQGLISDGNQLWIICHKLLSQMVFISNLSFICDKIFISDGIHVQFMFIPYKLLSQMVTNLGLCFICLPDIYILNLNMFKYNISIEYYHILARV